MKRNERESPEGIGGMTTEATLGTEIPGRVGILTQKSPALEGGICIFWNCTLTGMTRRALFS